VKKGDQAMTDAVNSFLKKIKENGQYKEIYKKWFKEEPK
jgi:ABC-type amino acid transport substrate-binding protein